MDFANFLFHLKRIKNVITASNQARLMMATTVDGGTEFKRECIVETVALAAAASVNLTTQLPAGARVVNASYFLTTAQTLSTATKLGIGISGKPSAFLLSGVTMTINTTQTLPVTPTTPADAAVAAATTIVLSTVDNSGAAAGSGTGTVKVCVIYEYQTALAA